MNDTAMIAVIIGGLLLAAGYFFAYRGGKDPATHEMDYEKEVRRQLADQDRRGRRAEQQQDEAEERARRFDQLLSKWEEQARRQDAILDHLEKQHGIKKG